MSSFAKCALFWHFSSLELNQCVLRHVYRSPLALEFGCRHGFASICLSGACSASQSDGEDLINVLD